MGCLGRSELMVMEVKSLFKMKDTLITYYGLVAHSCDLVSF